KGIGRVQQFAEIAVAHRERRHGPGIGAVVTALDPLLGNKKEQFVAVAIEALRDEYRTAHVKPVLVEAVWRGAAGNLRDGAVVARPGIGVERGVAEILDQVAVKRPRAALGYEANLAGRRAAIFRRVVR